MGCLSSKTDVSDSRPPSPAQQSPRLSADKKLKELLVQNNFVHCNENGHNNSSTKRRRRCENTMLDRLSSRMRANGFDARLLNSYHVKTLIGKGSFSRVVLAEHRFTQQRVAVKLIPVKGGSGVGSGNHIENELRIMSELKHANIVRLIEIFRGVDRIYMVLELATGGELYDRIVAKGSYSERDASGTLRMILNGVTYLHRNGVTHRDLKPENLLYHHPGPESKLLITDFGLAHQRRTADDIFMTDPCGTPEYIAPEVLARIPYTNKVDSWAVGVIAYILLSGTMPFDDEDRTIMYRHILRGRYHFHYEYWCHISDEAKEFVISLLTVDPDHRPSAEMALMDPWISNSCKNKEKIIRHLQKSRSLEHSKRRSRSSRSVRSIVRSDAGHRIDRREVERLHQDPEVQQILQPSRRPVITNYGLV